MSNAYDSAVPADNDDDSAFEPVALADAYDHTDSSWKHESTPLRWLFASEGRAKLVEHAVEAATQDELVYHNKSSLGKEADVSRHSAHRHIDDLVELGIYRKRAREGSVTRYKPNRDSRVLRALYTANTEIESYVSNAP